MSDLAARHSHYTRRVVDLAVRVVVEDGLPYRAAEWHLWRDHRVFVPWATIQNWVEAGGKKAKPLVEHEYLDWALSDFSGYIAVDELYDGPFCVLSLVDNRTFRRVMYDVLDYDPTQDDIEALLERFKRELTARGLHLSGITTDGSRLYPEAIAKVFGSEMSHQICKFHVLSDITKSIRSAVAQTRRELKANMPKLPQGRRTGRTKRLARRRQRIQQKVSDLYTNRYLFVKRGLTQREREELSRITRGLPHLRTLRHIMEETYRLFDRRCCTDTALDKLDSLRRRVRRFTKIGEALKKLFSPNLEKALTFLNDSLLPSTSNAVERGNRRYRKMQKTIYGVRTKEHIEGRIAMDMLRDYYREASNQILATLHQARAGPAA